jgi:hypothetical protein
MTFFYYEIQTRRFIQSTNIRALEEFSGISYNKIRGWFINGDSIHFDESIICGCSELVRGKQRIQKSEKNKSEKLLNDNTGPTEHLKPTEGDSEPFVPGDLGPTGEEMKGNDSISLEVKIKRETRQPAKRDGSGFDDFFKEVK